jgi:hypothetical protein
LYSSSVNWPLPLKLLPFVVIDCHGVVSLLREIIQTSTYFISPASERRDALCVITGDQYHVTVRTVGTQSDWKRYSYVMKSAGHIKHSLSIFLNP